MDADVAQPKPSNNKCYVSAFRYNIDIDIDIHGPVQHFHDIVMIN